MGEERTSGTHSWHLTLPISTTRLWLIKLAVALIGNAFCLTLVTLSASLLLGQSFSSAYGDVFGRDLGFMVCFSSLLAFAAFWCACTIKGSVSAALAVVPAGDRHGPGHFLGHVRRTVSEYGRAAGLHPLHPSPVPLEQSYVHRFQISLRSLRRKIMVGDTNRYCPIAADEATVSKRNSQRGSDVNKISGAVCQRSIPGCRYSRHTDAAVVQQ